VLDIKVYYYFENGNIPQGLRVIFVFPLHLQTNSRHGCEDRNNAFF